MPVGPADLRLVHELVVHIAPRDGADRDDMVSDGALALVREVAVWDSRPDLRAETRRSGFLARRVRDSIIEGMRTRSGRSTNRDGSVTYRKQDFEQGMLRLDNEETGSLLETQGRPEDGFGNVTADDLLARLPEREREVVRRTVLERESPAVVGRDLGMSEPMCCKIRANALARLRHELPGTEALSAREVEVIAWVAEGLRNPEIGARLHISEETVKSHLRHIHEKLGARSRSHAVALAFRAGLIF